MDVIRLKNMVFYGYHGVSDSEKNLGGKFEVDLELFQPLKSAGLSDDLKKTIDYEEIYRVVDKCVKENKYYLIEALAENISKTILKNHSISNIIVRVRKPHASIKGVLDTVEVEIHREKAEYD